MFSIVRFDVGGVNSVSHCIGLCIGGRVTIELMDIKELLRGVMIASLSRTPCSIRGLPESGAFANYGVIQTRASGARDNRKAA